MLKTAASLFVAFALTSTSLRAECSTAKVAVAPDESLTIAAYIEQGASSPDHEWNAEEYQQLAEVLKAIGEKDVRQLPRFDSEASGALMRRLVSTENFGTLRNRDFQMGVRFQDAATMLQSSAAITSIYLEANGNGEVFDRELVELMAFMMRTSVEVWAITDELKETSTPEGWKAFDGPLETMRNGTAQAVRGVVDTFSETYAYRPAELRRFATLIADTLPELQSRVSGESAAEVNLALAKIVQSDCDKELTPMLGRLLDRLKQNSRPLKPADSQ